MDFTKVPIITLCPFANQIYSIIAVVCGLGKISGYSFMDTSNEQAVNTLLKNIHRTINARILMFDPVIEDHTDPLLPDGVTENSMLLLSRLSKFRDRSRVSPINTPSNAHE